MITSLVHKLCKLIVWFLICGSFETKLRQHPDKPALASQSKKQKKRQLQTKRFREMIEKHDFLSELSTSALSEIGIIVHQPSIFEEPAHSETQFSLSNDLLDCLYSDYDPTGGRDWIAAEKRALEEFPGFSFVSWDSDANFIPAIALVRSILLLPTTQPTIELAVWMLQTLSEIAQPIPMLCWEK